MIVAVNGLNRFSIWRQLINYAVIKVAISSHGERSWYWRGGHHQHMWRNNSFRPQPRPLRHTKSVLLICHSKTEVFEFNGIFYNSMRTYKQINGSFLQLLQNFFSFTAFYRACK